MTGATASRKRGGRRPRTIEELTTAGRTLTVFGRAIRRGRMTKGLTQRQVAKACGIPIGTLNEWETGACAPLSNVHYLTQLARVCGLDRELLTAVADMERTDPGYLRLPIDHARIMAQGCITDYPNIMALQAILDGKEDALLLP